MASFWENVRGLFQRKYDSYDLFREVYGGRVAWAGKSVSLKTALQVSTALACGRVIAEGIAMLPWKVMQRKGKSLAPAEQHPMFDRLAARPNPLQTAFEFQETMGLHLSFAGNAYAWMPTVGRRVDAMWLIDPTWMRVHHKWAEMPTYEVRPPNGEVMPLTSADVWHIRGPSWSSYVGMEFLELARQALGLSMAIEESQAKLQANGASPSGILSAEGTLTEDQQKKLKKWIEEEHAGSSNNARTMILDRGMKFMQTGMTNLDAQVLEQRRFAVEEVCRFMRVLPIMVGHADKSQTYASSEQQFLAHLMFTLGPWARRLEQSADARLLTDDERAQGYYTNLNEKAVMRMTAQSQSEVLRTYTASGIMTRNEARELLDLNPLPGLDEPLTAVNTVAGEPPRAADPEPKPEPADAE